MSEKETKTIGEALDNIQRIFNKALKGYSQEERKQMAKQIMEDYKSGKN